LTSSCTTYSSEGTLCKTAKFLTTANASFMGFNSGWWEGDEEQNGHVLPVDYQLYIILIYASSV
jgi:hypothetical protein